jgi:hypothetical protein
VVRRFLLIHRSRFAALAVLLALLPLLAACGGDGEQGGQIHWTEGQPLAAAQDTSAPTAAPTTQPAETPTAPIEPNATTANEPQPTTQPGPSGEAVKLSASELQTYKPNEIGLIPILEYHQLVTDPAKEAAYVRTIAKFKKDLQWL